MPLRDGTRTVGDLYRPADGPPVPALVSRNPYDREVELRAVSVLPSPAKLAERGYAVLLTDVRGRYGSEGTFTPFVNEGQDGYDTVEWAAAQPWCDGNVGIYGPSYLGVTTLLAARERPPSLRCAIPIVTADDYFRDWVYKGGAFYRGFAEGWARGQAATDVSRRDPELRDRFIRDIRGRSGDQTLPLSQSPGLAVPEAAPWWNDWLKHDRLDEYWLSMSPARDYADYDVPMLHVGGWWDLFGSGTVRNYQGMRAAGKAPQHLWIGPWAHTHYDSDIGVLRLGPAASAAGCGVIAAFNRFIDQHLRGGEPRLATVRYFMLGANEWRDADDWPPSNAQQYALYLHSGGRANSARGDGLLSEQPPERPERPDRYLFDPERPVPSADPAGPQDQREVEARDDVLCYTSEPLTAPLSVAGPVQVELWAASDAPDTDWTATLVDVYPDGRAISLCDGLLRARFRTSFAEPLLLEPGKAECYALDAGNIACVFPAGHRVRLEISSSAFPKYDINPNTGNSPASDSHRRPAIQSILHDAEHPTRLVLHVLPGD